MQGSTEKQALYPAKFISIRKAMGNRSDVIWVSLKDTDAALDVTWEELRTRQMVQRQRLSPPPGLLVSLGDNSC